MACEQIKSLAGFQSFPVSFQSLTTDLEMLIGHLLIADSRSTPFRHSWWMHFKNRHSFGKPKRLFGFSSSADRSSLTHMQTQKAVVLPLITIFMTNAESADSRCLVPIFSRLSFNVTYLMQHNYSSSGFTLGRREKLQQLH